MRKAVLALFTACVSLMPMAPALAQPETRIKGADIMKHPIGPLALQYVDLVQAGRMEDALKLSHDKAQAEWKKYPAERRKPELLKASRKRRIAAGAGVQVQEVNRLLSQFENMQKMMKMMRGGNLGKMMRNMKGMLPGGR